MHKSIKRRNKTTLVIRSPSEFAVDVYRSCKLPNNRRSKFIYIWARESFRSEKAIQQKRHWHTSPSYEKTPHGLISKLHLLPENHTHFHRNIKKQRRKRHEKQQHKENRKKKLLSRPTYSQIKSQRKKWSYVNRLMSIGRHYRVRNVHGLRSRSRNDATKQQQRKTTKVAEQPGRTTSWRRGEGATGFMESRRVAA
jgi:hypothetical protein